MSPLYLLPLLLLLLLIPFSGGRSRHRTTTPPSPPVTSQVQSAFQAANTNVTEDVPTETTNTPPPEALPVEDIPSPLLLPGLLGLGTKVLLKRAKEGEENS